MARTKAQTKAKEPVKVRFKQLANGNQSIYLDCYVNGKRSYEFLNLYLVKENTPIDKQQNKATLNAANNIKAQRVIEIANGKAGLSSKEAKEIDLLDWVDIVAEATEKEPQGKSNAASTRTMKTHLQKYIGGSVPLSSVDDEFCRGFAMYLKTAKTKTGNPMKANTQADYFCRLSAVCRKAVIKGYLNTNPCDKVDGKARPKNEQGQRDFLSIDELKKLIDTDTNKPKWANAFLFSCMSGLRLSDIQALKWGNISADNTTITTRMQKTQQNITIPLPNVAQAYLPQRGNAKDTDNVFSLPTSVSGIEGGLKRWATAAGVTAKHVTFHVGRHTYATIMLERGADIYTIAKLLGHKNVATTQIYATLLEKKKAEAANLLDNIF